MRDFSKNVFRRGGVVFRWRRMDLVGRMSRMGLRISKKS